MNHEFIMPALLAVAVLLMGVLAFRLQHRHSFDWADMLCDTDDRPSLMRVGLGVAIFVASWLMIYLALHDRMTEGYLGLYLSALVLGKAWEKATEMRANC
jgi:hypothetical protein